MRKHIKNFFILFVLTISGIFLTSDVDAETLSYFNSGYYYMRFDSRDNRYGSEVINFYTIDGMVAYCIEPGVYEGTDGYVPGSWEDTSLSKDVMDRVLTIAYYGYSYVGHETDRYRMATQALIWEAIMGEGSWIKISTEMWYHGNPLDLTYERQNIEKLVENHYIKPSFDGQSFDAIVGKPIVLHDENKVLGDYDVHVMNADFSVVGNDLIITPKVEGNLEIRLTKKLIYPSDYKVFVGDGIQNILAVGNMEPIVSMVNLEVKDIRNRISILKQYGSVNGDSTMLNAENGIIFEIYDDAGNKYNEVITDENGYAEFELSYGVWRLHQVNVKHGFEKIPDFYVTVDETSNKIQYYNVLNNSLAAYLRVLKVDSETGQRIAIAGTTFKILNLDTLEYISQYVGGQIYDEFKTDEEGKFTTYLKLPAGHYKLLEIASPIGYLLNKEGVEFTIDETTIENYTDYGAIVTVEYANSPIKGMIEINKTGEKAIVKDGKYIYEKIPLENVKFEIYADEDIYYSDRLNLQFSKGDLVETLVTDHNGYAISRTLPLGKYRLIEVSTGEDHVLEQKIYYVALTEIDNRTEIVFETLNIENVLKKGKIDFTKTDLTTGEPIGGAIFEIYNLDDELVYRGISDENGKILIDNLPAGAFYIKEIEAATGYVLSDDKKYFEIMEDGEIVKVNMTNEKIKSFIKILKVDELGHPIAGVKIGIYDVADNLILEALTSTFGSAEFQLPYGSYYYKEIETIDGYRLNDQKFYFDVTKDEEYFEYTLVNETIKVPKTGMNESIFINVVSFITLLVGVGSLIYEKKKR